MIRSDETLQSEEIEKHEKYKPISKKIVVWSGPGGTKTGKNHALGVLGWSCSCLGGGVNDFVMIFNHLKQQVAPKSRQDPAKMPNLVTFTLLSL